MPDQILRSKKVVISGTLPQSEEGKGLDVGKNAVKDLIQHHGGLFGSKIQGNSNLLIIGNLAGQVKVQEAERRGVKVATLDTLTRLLQGQQTFQEFIMTPAPEITEYSASFQGIPSPGQMAEATGPPPTEILESTTNSGSQEGQLDPSTEMIASPPRRSTGRGTNTGGPNEEETADKVVFNTPSFRRICTPVTPAATTARPDLSAGTLVTSAVGSWQMMARGWSQQATLPRYTAVVNVEVK
jgi:hypothetical protein